MLFGKTAFRKNGSIAAVQGMVATYGNVGYLGVPLLIATFGMEAALPAALATLIYNVFIIAMFLILFAFLAVRRRWQR